MHRNGLSLSATLTATLLTGAGCTIDANSDPAGLLGGIGDALQSAYRDLADALADPLDGDALPAIVGGDSARILYVTNLGDVRVRFPGPTGDLLLPGILGPSNLYRYQNDDTRLLRPLIPSGGVTGLASDGDALAYVFLADLTTSPARQQVIVSNVFLPTDDAIYDTQGRDELITNLRANAGQLAFAIRPIDVDESAAIRLYSLATNELQREIDTPGLQSLDLRVGRLAWLQEATGGYELNLLESGDNDPQVVHFSSATPGQVFVTNNFVVWSEDIGAGVQRVMAYELAEGLLTVWDDAVIGELRGATDAAFVVEEPFQNDSDQQRTRVMLYELGKEPNELANLPANPLVGQTQILGDRVVFVNDDRKIVVKPLDGTERFNFEPF